MSPESDTPTVEADERPQFEEHPRNVVLGLEDFQSLP